MFMRNLLTFPDSLLKKINLDLSFVGSNINIKLHLSVFKVIFWRIQMHPVGPLQPLIWTPCSPSATSTLNLIMYITRRFSCQFGFGLLSIKAVDVISVWYMVYWYMSFQLSLNLNEFLEFIIAEFVAVSFTVYLAAFFFKLLSSQNDGNILLFCLTKNYFYTVITV